MRRKENRRSDSQYSNLFLTYYGTVGLFLFGWLLSEARVWGFNWWAYQPIMMQATLVLIACVAGPVLRLWSNRITDKASTETSDSGRSGAFWTLVAVTIGSFALLYYLLPATTHFLGDGYSVLARLTHGIGSQKSWDIGASFLNDTIFNSLGVPSEENALLTYRIIAVSSGLLMLTVVAVVAHRLFESFMNRSLFLIGVASSGYALHFFGYVENYALFVVMVITFTLFGLLATLGKASRWLAIIPALLACGLHIFGIALLPALLYILFCDRWPLVQIGSMSRRGKVMLWSAIIVIALSAYFFLFYNYYFFRFAFLPILPDRFTVDNDYLLSPKHIVDFINLLILLVPGITIFLMEVVSNRRKRLWSGHDMRFLLLLLASTSACIYLFNPGIGMPRNWDLFSLPGIPLAVLVYYTLLSSRQSERRRFLSAAMTIALGFLLLVPRVWSQRTPKIAIAHFKNYIELDRTRNRNARSLLTDYYRSKGDQEAATRWNSLAVQEFPEANLTNQGKQMLRSGNIQQAEALFRRAIKINPIFVDAYSNLGTCYINRGQLDKALEFLEIADGLNPLSASVINNKGTVYLRLGDLHRAEGLFLEALRVESSNVSAMAGLVSVNVQQRDDQTAAKYLEILRNSPELSVEYFKEGVAVCLEAGLMQSARIAFNAAIELGASNRWQQELKAKNPKLLQ